MDVTFYSFSKKRNSTAQPTGGTTLSCQLKQPTAISNPTFIIGAWNRNYNYCYVATWGRYYFIEDITILNGQRAEIACSCDVLATYKSNITSYNAFVERSASQHTEYVSDGLVTNFLKIVNQDHTLTTFPDPFNRETGCFVMRVVNGNSGPTGLSTYVLTQSQLNSVMDFMFNDTSYQNDILKDEVTKTFFNPFQYIVNLMWFPLAADKVGGTSATVKFGWWDSGKSARLLDSVYSSGVIFNEELTLPTNVYSDFRRYHPAFSSYYIYLPNVGLVSMSPTDVESGLHCVLVIDMTTGNAEYRLQEGNGNIISTFQCKYGVPIQIGQIAPQGTSLANSLISAGNALMSGSVGSVLSGFNSVQSAIAPTASINGNQGSRYLITAMPYVSLTCINYGTCDIPNTVAGRPLYKNVTLSTLSGFCKCAGASVPMRGYVGEKDQVDNYLNEGFYLE